MGKGQEPVSEAGFEDPEAQEFITILRFHAKHDGVFLRFLGKVLKSGKDKPWGEEGVGFMRSTLEMIPSVHEFGAEVSGSVLSDDESPPTDHLFDPGSFAVEPVPVGFPIRRPKDPAFAIPALFSLGGGLYRALVIRKKDS